MRLLGVAVDANDWSGPLRYHRPVTILASIRPRYQLEPGQEKGAVQHTTVRAQLVPPNMGGYPTGWPLSFSRGLYRELYLSCSAQLGEPLAGGYPTGRNRTGSPTPVKVPTLGEEGHPTPTSRVIPLGRMGLHGAPFLPQLPQLRYHAI